MSYDYREICFSTRIIVEETAKFIEAEIGNVRRSQIEDKDHNSLVSYVDKTAEQKLVKGLRSILPAATFLTEEKTVANDEDSTLRWIIDPLDGTTNFLHQIPIFSVSVALQHAGEIVVGIVYEINRKECFYAWQRGGAYLNGEAIQVGRADVLSESIIATGYPSRKFDLLDPYFDALRKLMIASRGMRRLGSAAVDMAYVACGRFHGFFEYGLKPWDVAAGALIAREAGGQITDFAGGTNFLYDGEMLVSNDSIHAPLLNILKPAFGKE